MTSQIKILTIDDEQPVRDSFKNYLEDFEYIVFEAENGIEALEHFFQKERLFDVIILDMVMPLMSGKEAYERIREKSTTQKILLYSGNISNQYVGELNLAKVLENSNTRYLQKPFRQHELLEVIGSFLPKQPKHQI